MITNERQYRIGNAQLKRFEDALAAQDAREGSAEVDPRIHQSMRDATPSEIDELRSQLARYDDLRAGRVGQRIRSGGMTDSEAVRTALREAAARRRVRSAIREEVRRVAARRGRSRGDAHHPRADGRVGATIFGV